MSSFVFVAHRTAARAFSTSALAAVLVACGGQATDGTGNSGPGGASGSAGSSGASGSVGSSGTAGTTGNGGAGGAPMACQMNSDCPGAFVCTSGLCREECQTTKDCPTGQRCVSSGVGSVCQVQQEAVCHANSDCNAPLVCAPDGQCRNQCVKDTDCIAGEVCTNGICL